MSGLLVITPSTRRERGTLRPEPPEEPGVAAEGFRSRPSGSLSPQEAIQLDGEILFSLLQKVSPVAHKHLSQQKIDPLLYMTEWFMCAFSRTLPWSSVLRVWDMFFCEGTGRAQGSGPAPSPAHGGLCLRGDSPEQPPLPALTARSPTGVKIIFRVGLVLLKHALGSPEKVKGCQGQYETIERLRSLSPKIMQEAFLVQEVWPPVPLTPEMGELTVTRAPHPWREGGLTAALPCLLRSLSPEVMQEAFLVQEVRPPLPLTPGGRVSLRALVGARSLVLSSPGQCGQTSSFCLNK